LGFSLIQNHPFLDGNKRVGHAAIVAFLRLNGQRLVATVDEAERIILGVASGELSREEFVHWIKTRSDPSEESGIT
jgi:death-on-curing protein